MIEANLRRLNISCLETLTNPNFARGGEFEGAPEALARARNYPSIDENYLNYDFLIYQSGSLLRHKDNPRNHK